MASANSTSTHETDPSRVSPPWHSTEVRVDHKEHLAYYLSPEGLDSLGPGIQHEAVCYVPSDESKRVYFAITGTDLKHPGGTTIWQVDYLGRCDESEASMTEYKTGQFGQVDTVTYKGYTRPDTGRKVERTFRSDRKLPNDQTARQQVGETEQGTPIWSFIHHWDCKLVKVNDDSTYADTDAPVTSLSGLYPGQTLWSAASRVISEAPFIDYRTSEILTDPPVDEKLEAEQVKRDMKIKRSEAEMRNCDSFGRPLSGTITEAAWAVHRSMGRSYRDLGE